MEVVLLLWILTILVPIHGAFYLGARAERQRVRALVTSYWRLRK